VVQVDYSSTTARQILPGSSTASAIVHEKKSGCKLSRHNGTRTYSSTPSLTYQLLDLTLPVPL